MLKETKEKMSPKSDKRSLNTWETLPQIPSTATKLVNQQGKCSFQQSKDFRGQKGPEDHPLIESSLDWLPSLWLVPVSPVENSSKCE